MYDITYDNSVCSTNDNCIKVACPIPRGRVAHCLREKQCTGETDEEREDQDEYNIGNAGYRRRPSREHCKNLATSRLPCPGQITSRGGVGMKALGVEVATKCRLPVWGVDERLSS
jgi:hypothetical protein